MSRPLSLEEHSEDFNVSCEAPRFHILRIFECIKLVQLRIDIFHDDNRSVRSHLGPVSV